MPRPARPQLNVSAEAELSFNRKWHIIKVQREHDSKQWKKERRYKAKEYTKLDLFGESDMGNAKVHLLFVRR